MVIFVVFLAVLEWFLHVIFDARHTVEGLIEIYNTFYSNNFNFYFN